MQEILTNILTNIFLGLLALVGAYILYFIRLVTSYLKQKINSSKFDEVIKQIDKLAETTVKSIEQTTAKELRQAVKDGKISKDELESLSNEAFAKIIEELQPEYFDLLKDNITNAENYILDVIEQKVLELKGGAI